jgi:hypothetical protein
MRQRSLFRLAERRRRLRRVLAVWRGREPKPLVIALVGMAMGLSLFLLMLGLVGLLRLLDYVAKALR